MNEGTSATSQPVDAEDGESEGDDAYVHQPRSSPPSRAPTGEGTFDWRGWLLVGVIVFAFFVVPGAILVLPEAQGFIGTLGLTLRDAYLVLPLVPAFLLAAVAVWAAVRSRSS
ncbi:MULTISPECIES: hypothetical protein [Salinibaculum]|uniref:hypothetical protein n=1 Tax=Salinibaculum TaxID=2732368 RepID=UPI0030D2DF5F